MQLKGYQQVKLVSGPFSGLLGKTLNAVGDAEKAEKWYVEIMLGGRPVIQEIPTEHIEVLK